MINENKKSGIGEALVGLGIIVAGGYLVSTLIDELFGTSHDTVNYKLKRKKRVVYHGICKEYRLDARLNEHENDGKKFDECIYDEAKPRKHASSLERKRIKRDRPLYNIQHKI